MLSVDQAKALILENVCAIGVETAHDSSLNGRILAKDVTARITQPPFSASAMDGYAVQFASAKTGASLEVIGEAPAGAPFDGVIEKGQAVRIFTGGVVPEGADHVVIQEDVTRTDNVIVINEAQRAPRNIRAAGIDFQAGDILAKEGDRLHEIHGSIFAAANMQAVEVYRRPRIAIFSNGDELVEPGGDLQPGQIVNSNHYALCALANRWGGVAEYLGCARDSEDDIRDYFRRGKAFDIIVSIGGASVGDYDYVKSAFSAEGGTTKFEKVAVRPGKPTWCGKLGEACVIGLPGNPASAIVTGALFLQPLVRRLAGDVKTPPVETGQLTAALGANGARESYLRGELLSDGIRIDPASNQDSSLLTPFAKANVLIRRLPNAAALGVGDEVEIVRLL